MRALIAKLTRLLNPRAARIADAEALVGSPVRLREEGPFFGWPRITAAMTGMVHSANKNTGELLVRFPAEIPGTGFFLHLFPNEIVREDGAYV